jgi:hypothetical protein
MRSSIARPVAELPLTGNPDELHDLVTESDVVIIRA